MLTLAEKPKAREMTDSEQSVCGSDLVLYDEPEVASKSVPISEDKLYVSYVERYSEEIKRSINPDELILHMQAHCLLTFDALGDLVHLSLSPRNQKVQLVLSALKEGDYSVFIKCLEETKHHIGHEYVLSLLKNVPYASSKQVDKSEVLKNCIRKNLKTLQNVNMPLLRPYLFQNKLLTLNELEWISRPEHHPSTIATDLFQLLQTKGPTAFIIFRKCLKKATKGHDTHKDLLELMDEALRKNRKRKHSSDSVSVSKRIPDRLHLQDGLVSPFYLDNIKAIRRLHLLGKWKEADEIAEVCISSSTSLEIEIAIRLECCTSLITRRHEDSVLSIVQEAQEKCTHLQGDSSTALRGRSQWVLAKLHRYMGNMDLATTHITNARDICFNLTAGEDTALISYCSACISLASNAKQYSSSTVDKAKRDFDVSIRHASKGDYGLSLFHPKIRLAQLHLGSSHYTPGRNSDSESIDGARALLDEINIESLAIRSLCTYRYTQSDLYRNENNPGKALECAQNVMQLATENGFATEIISAKKRLKLLAKTSDGPE